MISCYDSEMGWNIFQAMQRNARTPEDTCFTSLSDVTRVPTVKKDVLESFVFVSGLSTAKLEYSWSTIVLTFIG